MTIEEFFGSEKVAAVLTVIAAILAFLAFSEKYSPLYRDKKTK